MSGWSEITKEQFESLKKKERAFFASDNCKIIMFLDKESIVKGRFFFSKGKKIYHYYAKVKGSCSDLMVQAGAKVI